MSKRKRSQADEDATADQDGPRKTRVLDGEESTKDDAAARAAARQAKSERRSKKKDASKKSSKAPKSLPKPAESLVPDQQPAADVDHFSSNNDFVSLDGRAAAVEAKPAKKPKAAKKTSTQSSAKDSQAQQHRFILFIGNLPFTSTPEAIKYHFRALEPFSVRFLTDKKTKKFRGTAFIEFQNYDKMKTCLKLYHHSLFDPDAHLSAEADSEEKGPKDSGGNKSGKKSGSSLESTIVAPPKDHREQWQKPRADKTRRINVELTAGGGGGKSTARRQKIQTKNAKLAEERERFAKKEAEDREKKRFEGGGKGKGTGANADSQGADEGDRGHVHPSRLRRVRG